jgi:anti-anti-sigma regulatory factor
MSLTLSPPFAGDSRDVRSSLLADVVRIENGCAVVALRGEAHVSTGAVLSDALSQAIARGAGAVLIDLADVPFIDVVTGRMFAITHRFLDRTGVNWALGPRRQRPGEYCTSSG